MNFGLGGLGATGSGISLVRILGSLSKTVGIVRQFAPIYRDMKPLLKKAPAFFQRLNSIRNAAYSMNNISSNISNQNIDYGGYSEINPVSESSTGPVFFQ